MKKSFFLCLMLLLMLVTVGKAGNYHNDPLICSDCHAMHASINDAGNLYNAGAGYTNLLKAANTNSLCLQCHSAAGPNYATSGAPGVADYVGDDTFAGGGFNMEGQPQGGVASAYAAVTAATDYPDTRGHDLYVAAGAQPSPPGFSDNWDNATNFMTCATCHDQHGNANYRNLKADPNTVNANIVTLAPDATTYAYSGKNQRYDSDVWQGTATYNSDLTLFCLDCHEKFGPDNTWDPSTQSIQGAATGDYDNQGLVDNSAGANTHHPIDFKMTVAVQTNYDNEVGGETYPLLKTSAGNSAVFCLTCHRAHGSQNVDGLRFDPSASALNGGPEACQVCHAK